MRVWSENQPKKIEKQKITKDDHKSNKNSPENRRKTWRRGGEESASNKKSGEGLKEEQKIGERKAENGNDNENEKEEKEEK